MTAVKFGRFLCLVDTNFVSVCSGSTILHRHGSYTDFKPINLAMNQ
jgi:hypothetical protein